MLGFSVMKGLRQLAGDFRRYPCAAMPRPFGAASGGRRSRVTELARAGRQCRSGGPVHGVTIRTRLTRSARRSFRRCRWRNWAVPDPDKAIDDLVKASTSWMRN